MLRAQRGFAVRVPPVQVTVGHLIQRIIAGAAEHLAGGGTGAAVGQYGVQAHGHEHKVLPGGADGAKITHAGGILENAHNPGDATLFRDLNQHVRAAAAALGQRLLKGVQHDGQGAVGADVGLGGLAGERVGKSGRFRLRLRFGFWFRLWFRLRHHYGAGFRRLLRLIAAGHQAKCQRHGQQQSDPFLH